MMISCPSCAVPVCETAPACPACGNLVSVEHPGDISGVKHFPLEYPSGGIFTRLISVLAAVTFVR